MSACVLPMTDGGPSNASGGVPRTRSRLTSPRGGFRVTLRAARMRQGRRMARGTMAEGGAVLVTGGAGYIGSHVVLALCRAGWPVVVLDDLSTGRRSAVPAGVGLVVGDVGDRALVGQLFQDRRIAAVLHLAGSIQVAESVQRPLAYYRNNTQASLTLIEACVAAGIAALVFSSTAAVYGSPERAPVHEEAPTRPLSPYGRSKLMTEQILRDTGAGASAASRHPALLQRRPRRARRIGPAVPGDPRTSSRS
jgi:FlaA1/EpsC-like NDP-sugar epimerase